MGRARRKYKAKPTIITDDTEQKKIEVDFDSGSLSRYDESNALVLPSGKRKTKKLHDITTAPVKLLSKKKRKHLEKIVDKKRKKANRVSLLSALEEVKADPKELEMMVQLQSTQTLGRKRFSDENFTILSKSQVEEDKGRILSSIKGKKKISQMIKAERNPVYGSNVVRLGDVSSEDSESDDEIEESCDGGEEVADCIGLEANPQEDSNSTTDHPKSSDGKQEPLDRELSSSDASVTNDTANSVCDVAEDASGDTLKCESAVVKSSVTLSKNVQPAVYVTLRRTDDVQKERLKLPILAEEQSIMEAINENSVTVIVGSTGSGKTTQVPQFLYEAGYTSGGQMIGITEPRRVAAISMSQRVAYEMNMTPREVSYQIRFEGNTSPDTKLKFMTDGVLLKEIQLDPTLKKYSAIIIDEAHERSIFSDILIGILSRIIPIRRSKKMPLKLIIMSATLRVEDFTENARLFKDAPPPVIKVESRMFDVTIHYNKRTVEDYVEEAYKKVCKIHRQLPDGGILVFLTGQQEVNTLMSKLRKTFPLSGSGYNSKEKVISGYQKGKQLRREKKKTGKDEGFLKKIVLPEVKLEDFTSAAFLDDTTLGEEVYPKGKSHALDSLDESLMEEDELSDEEPNNVPFLQEEKEQPLYVLPLYSLLPPDRQQLVFQPPPEGTRICVVATNVAETSLTIPNIKYVVDSGKIKRKVYDKVTGVSMFHVTWTSKASANQRSGRAGRTAPGHSYRLYSSAVFENEFPKFPEAEIQQRPIDDIVLIMKSMNLPVMTFPFPKPPDNFQICSSMKRLRTLGALKEKEMLGSKALQHKNKKLKPEAKDTTAITQLGKAMAAFPLAPRYGKMLALSHQHSLLPYTIAIVAALTIPEVLLETPLETKQAVEDVQRRWQSVRYSWAGTGNSRKLGDVMVLLQCVGSAEFQKGDEIWCEKNGLRHKALTEIRKLRRQLTNEVNLIIPTLDITLDPRMPPPTDEQAHLLCQIVTAGLIDHVAYRVNEWELKDPSDKIKWKNAYRTQDLEEPVFLPASSVVRVDMPQWVVFQDIHETHKMFMRNVCVIEPQWLAVFAPHLCSFSPPLESPEPHYDVYQDRVLCRRSAKFGSSGWQMPDVEVEYPHSQDLFRWVAYFFLKGDLCSPLKVYTSYLYDPKVMVNPVAIRYRQQRENILLVLMSRDITNLAKLHLIWSSEPSYLLNEYLQWIEDKDIHSAVRQLWPPVCHNSKDNGGV